MMSVFDFAFNLAWLIPLFPFLAFVAISLFTCQNRQLSHRLAIGGVAVSAILSQIVFWAAVLMPVGGGERAFESARIPWLPLGLEVFSLGVYAGANAVSGGLPSSAMPPGRQPRIGKYTICLQANAAP